MKRIIRWVAQISGVEYVIRKEAQQEFGNHIKSDAQWFTGLYYGNSIPELRIVRLAMLEIGEGVERGNWNVQMIREDVVEKLRDLDND